MQIRLSGQIVNAIASKRALPAQRVPLNVSDEDNLREEFLLLKAVQETSRALDSEASNKAAIIRNEVPKQVMRGEAVEEIVQRWHLVSKFKANLPN